MDTGSLYCKATMLLGAICMLLSVQGVGAQATNCTAVPPWGIAVLTMMCIMVVLILGFMLIIPCCCRKTKDDCQDGMSFYSPHFMFSGGDACQSNSGPVRQADYQPTCEPARQPDCQPTCPPVSYPVGRPVCQPQC